MPPQIALQLMHSISSPRRADVIIHHRVKEIVPHLFHRLFNEAGKHVKRPLISLAESNYYTARLLYFRTLHRNKIKYGKSPLLIYQMGKVGSSTIQRSLDALNLGMPIFHVHYLSKKRVEDLEKERRRYFGTEKYGLLKRPWLYQYLGKALNEKFDGQKWKIISLTRDPIARNLSAFFENLEFTPVSESGGYWVKSDYYRISPLKVNIDNLESLISLFFDRLYHESPLEFFDRELNKVFGIDVYSSAFPRSEGYKIYVGEKADALVIRLENLNRCAQLAFKEFFNTDRVNLMGSNIGSEKEYATLYSRFKDDIRLPESYINRMYRSKFVQHFYSDTEIKGLRSKWLRVDKSDGDRIA